MHFTDTVRAFADVYPARCVETAELASTVVDVRGDHVTLRLEGAVLTTQDDARSRGRLRRKPARGYDAELLGHATFDREANRFIAFELIALGTNRGGGLRSSFEDPVRMGVLLELATDEPSQRVAPNHLARYDW